MKLSTNVPVYAQVAYDIASQIANGKLKEGQRLSGRTILSSQYGVSSETIRRAMNLLANMNVVDIRQNVGVTVASRTLAIEYVEQYGIDNDLRGLKERLKTLTLQRNKLNEEISSLFEKIMALEERFQHSDQLRTYEFPIQPGSEAVGKTIGELKFRQKTGGTIVAVREDGEIQFSPGPQTLLHEDTISVVACNAANLSYVSELVR